MVAVTGYKTLAAFTCQVGGGRDKGNAFDGAGK
jgi:hypothetical protein